MKQATPAVLDTITNGYHVEVATVLHAEWLMNRYFRTVVENTPTEYEEGYDVDLFPIESITESNRPTSGICKAVVGQSFVTENYHGTVPSARFYTADVDDEYKYWQSPFSADALGVMTGCAPQVVYAEIDDVAGEPVPTTVTTNKIIYTVENTYAWPVDYDVQVKYTTGGAWETVASDIAVPANGKVELWWNGTNWTTTKNLAFLTSLSAVRLVVNTMDKEAFFNLIELGVALERDLTNDLIDWNDSFTMGEVDFLTPLGNISSNGGQVTLFNGDDNPYRNTDDNSLYHNLLDKGVRFTCWTKYGDDEVQEFELFSESWEEADDATTVLLVDGSQPFFMEVKPRPVLYENVSVQEVVWRICDIIGFNNYEVTTLDETEHSIIDIFWTNGEKTAWEIFSELARATQTAIYFDSYGVLQVKTRDAAWDSGQAPVYDFIRDTVPGGTPSNIVNLNESTEYEANKVSVNWHPTQFSERRDNITPFEVVWEPEGATMLRATPLAANLMIGGTEVQLSSKEGQTWPWKGIMNVEGEWISFNAKQYVHYDENETRQISWVESNEDKQRLDNKTKYDQLHRNTFTGKLRVEERGLFGTEEVDHTLDLNDWTAIRQRNYGANHDTDSAVKLDTGRSQVTIDNPKKFDMNDYTYLQHGDPQHTGYKYMGVRMRIDKSSHKDKVGGIYFNGGGTGAGYFLEIMATARMNGKMRKQRNEVMFYSMSAGGQKKVFGGETIKMKDRSKNHKKNAKIKKDIGHKLAVVQDRFIDFDIWVDNSGSVDNIVIFANGRRLFTANVDGTWRHTRSERFGLYARGHSSLTFDYVYAIDSFGEEMVDSESYYDRINGGYYSSQAIDWTYDTRTARRKTGRKRKGKRWKKYTQRYAQRFYDDFGPVAHEIREFDVKFTVDTPVLESRLYFSNDSQVVSPEYVGDISGGKFILVNISREPAVVSGEDEATTQGNGVIDHKLFVYGRPVILGESQTIEREDEWALRRRGVIDIEYDSPWIQNESEAERFAEWLTTHWSRSDTTLDVEVFGNPFIELTDVVRVQYNHIDALFYVTSITNNYEAGLTTQLQLRKVHDTI